ncbi:MAG TPA: TIGR00289 family protein [Methanobacterium sp.]|nr:MAG: TIGR00289 family protein [Methanobacterium sp.]HOI71451.1 TIGR00289 family protein [Methanobacterium sp.]
MKAAVLFSGGKDSTMAAYKAIEQGWEVKYLISMISSNSESYMFHTSNIHMTELAAQAMDMPLSCYNTPGIKEKELDDLKMVLTDMKNRGVEAIFSGAMYSSYQKSRIDKLCQDLSLKSVSPLWHKDPYEYMMELVDLDFKIIMVSVSAAGLDESWLGREIDREFLEDLLKIHEKHGVHMSFEGGEAETLVLDCPLFKKRIKIKEMDKVCDKDSGHVNIKKAVLVDK